MNLIHHPDRHRSNVAAALPSALVDGTLAAVFSGAVLSWLGHRAGNPAAPVNAPSHWLFGRKALRQDEASAKYTITGAAVHSAAALWWGALYRWVRNLRRNPTPANAFTDAAALTAVAAVVDLELVPERLSPGFEHRVTPAGLVLVYAAFALGLAAGGALLLRRR